jgi:hypothetical protein
MVSRLLALERRGWSGQQDLNLSQPLEIAQYRSDNCQPRRGVFPLFEPVRSDNGVESHRAGTKTSKHGEHPKESEAA